MSEAKQASYGDNMIAEKDGAVGWMIFNNPERHNALSFDMWEAIPRILDRFEADAEVRVIVLKGAGEKSFISGADISEFEAVRSTCNSTFEPVADSSDSGSITFAMRKAAGALITEAVNRCGPYSSPSNPR